MNYEYRCYVFVLLLVFCFLSLYVECMYVGSKPEGDLNCLVAISNAMQELDNDRYDRTLCLY